MSDNRWQRIEDIFHRAVEFAPELRSAFLNEVCADDESVRKEVESLLAHDAADGHTFMGAAGDDAPRTIAHYRITAKLGQGGMGAVYRATDTKLGREVAIKILPDAFAGDPDRMVRFTREAKVLASLNYPNIAAIYGVEDRALIMELVKGHDLRGPLPMATALNYARQITDALDAAHEKGIVHRDLKPANVKVTPEGVVKVLDFGLAAVTGGSAGDSNPDNSPTMTVAATQAGMIMGTAAYMSPEQASGKPVDKRADIWSFGVVLFELLTGHRLFGGETVAHTLAGVLAGPIDFGKLPRETPAAIRVLLRRCLERDAMNRLRDIGEARIAIDAALAGETPLLEGAPKPGGARRLWLAWGVAAALAVGLAPFAFLYFREKPPAPPPPVRFQIAAPESTTLWSLSLSPDGRKLAFIAGGRLWVHFLESGEWRDLTAVGGAPFWSPDSRFIGYSFQGKLKKIEATGGPPQTVADFPGNWGGGAWNQDDVIVFGDLWVGLFRVPASGGVPVAITALDPTRQEHYHFGPSFLPDGRHFIYTRYSTDLKNSAIYLGSVDVKPEQQGSKPLITRSWQAVHAPSADPSAGYLLFMRDGALMAQPFDSRRMELKGQAAPVAERVVGDNGTIGSAAFSASAGVLAYRAQELSWLRWFDRKGSQLGDVGPIGEYVDPELSPDGHALAVSMRTATNWDIGVFDLVRGTNSRLTFGGGDHYNPCWSPDGRQIAFRVVGGPRWIVNRVLANGAGKEELAAQLDRNAGSPRWTADGQYLILHAVGYGKPHEIWAVPMSGGGKPFPVVTGPFDNLGGRVSPDGKWIAYVGRETGRNEVYVQDFPPKGGKWQISTAGGWRPAWRADGRELFYREGFKMMSVDVRTSAGKLEAGNPKLLFDAPRSHSDPMFDVSADGQKFLLVIRNEEAGPPPITVVLNWQPGLKE